MKRFHSKVFQTGIVSGQCKRLIRVLWLIVRRR